MRVSACMMVRQAPGSWMDLRRAVLTVKVGRSRIELVTDSTTSVADETKSSAMSSASSALTCPRRRAAEYKVVARAPLTRILMNGSPELGISKDDQKEVMDGRQRKCDRVVRENQCVGRNIKYLRKGQSGQRPRSHSQ